MSTAVKTFSPAWFAPVMGTGILAVTSKYYAGYLPLLNTAAVLLMFDVIAVKLYGFACYWLLVIFWSAVALKHLRTLRNYCEVNKHINAACIPGLVGLMSAIRNRAG